MGVEKARLEAKVNLDIYLLLKQAAAMSGRTLTDFVVSVAYEEAKRTISEHQMLYLSLRDQELLMDRLSKPDEPNSSMNEALSVYEQYFLSKGNHHE